MAVHYVTVKSSLNTEEASNSKFVKVIKNCIVDKYKIAKSISDQCSMTESDIVAVLQAYETNLMMQFANGNSVEIFNLGTLKPCFKAEYDASGNVIKKSLRLSKVSLITSDKFVQNAKGYCYKFCGDVDYNQTTFEQRIDNCISYLKDQNTTITSHKYAIINQCSESTAKRDLSILAEQNVLFLERVGQTYLYFLNHDSIENDISSIDLQDTVQPIVKESLSDVEKVDSLIEDVICELPKSLNSMPVEKLNNTSNSVRLNDINDIVAQENIADNFAIKSTNYQIKNIDEIKNQKIISRRKSHNKIEDDDEYIKLFYEIIGGKFQQRLMSDNGSENDIISDADLILNASKDVIRKIASDMNIDDIYDNRVIAKLNEKIFPVDEILRMNT